MNDKLWPDAYISKEEVVEIIKQRDALQVEIGNLRKDQQRLNWLIRTSALHPDGETIVLCVTEKAVKSCSGTWLPEYHEQVRKVIDAGIKASKPTSNSVTPETPTIPK